MELAELYAQTNNNQFKDAAEIIEEYKDKLSWNNKNERVLDVGCGPGNTTGKLLLPIMPESAQLVGIDVSSEMIKFAQSTFGNDRLKFLTLDFSAKNVPNLIGFETFSKVFSFYCLHWITDQRKAVENIWNLLKPGGTALLVLVSWSSLFTLYKLMSKQQRWKEYMQDVDNYITPYQEVENPSEQYSNLLQDVGFKIIECYEREASVNAPTLETLKRSLTAVNPFLRRMSPTTKEEYMDDMMDLVVQQGLVEKKDSSLLETKLSHITPNQLIIAFCQKPK